MSEDYEKMVEQIQRHEGLRLKPYRCSAGKLTIGFGRNLEDVGITAHEARVMLETDLFRAKTGLAQIVPSACDLSPPRRAVLINMVFNLGVDGLLTFSRMLAALSIRDFDMVAEEMLRSEWNKQVGARSDELAEQMRTGSWRDG